jgi:hypothetical protein
MWLESLEEGRPVPPPGKWFSRDAVPRQLTYVTTEGMPPTYHRTILYMEQEVVSGADSSLKRRADFVSVTVEMSAAEVEALRLHGSFAKCLEMRPGPSATRSVEIRSYDFNTLISGSTAARHAEKHRETMFLTLSDIAERYRIRLSSESRVTAVAKEWYHKSPTWWDERLLGRHPSVTSARGFKFVEAHTVVMEWNMREGRLVAVAPHFEMIRYDRKGEVRRVGGKGVEEVARGVHELDLTSRQARTAEAKFRSFVRAFDETKALLGGFLRKK